MTEDRIERDSMGEVRVPASAHWRAQTQRAVENFPISGPGSSVPRSRRWPASRRRSRSVKAELELIDADLARAIIAAAEEVARGEHDDQFPIDVFQTGSGTSSNMNMNEVLATLAGESPRAGVHPNDDVNHPMSSNDMFPASIHIAATAGVVRDLVPALEHLGASLERKAGRVRRRRQVGSDPPHGRHAGDPGPGVRRLCRPGPHRCRADRRQPAHASPSCPWAAPPSAPASTPHPGSADASSRARDRHTALPLTEARDHFEAQGARDGLVELSGQLRTIAVSLTKIANDLRWMGSGPRAGLGEINLPDLQPGSSIMPGKVNPVIPEATLMVVRPGRRATTPPSRGAAPPETSS